MKEFHLQKNDYQNSSIEVIQGQIDRLTTRIDNLYLDKLDGKIAEEFWSVRHNQWMTQKSELLMQVEAFHDRNIKYYENMDLLLKFCRNAPLLYKEANIEQKRNIINLMFLKLFYNGSTLDIELKTVFENIRILPKSKNGAGDGLASETQIIKLHESLLKLERDGYGIYLRKLLIFA